MTTPLRPALAFVACSSSAAAALLLSGLMSAAAHAAEPAPPIKPGLWEITTASQQIDGQAMPDLGAQMAEQLKAMPPAMRQQIEAQMKSKGVQMTSGKNGDTAVRTCVSKESLDQNRWQAAQGDCKNQITERSGKTWKWKVSCTQPPSQGEGSTTFISPEAYTNDMRMTMSGQGKPQTMTMKHTAKWLSADCGGLKPIVPPPAK
ncbi:MAG: DUF3617 domain-containing protein [Rubrivivax sp.]|nr:MAG: DUF3617 domain-containing protein [Rubrivivax sp.]